MIEIKYVVNFFQIKYLTNHDPVKKSDSLIKYGYNPDSISASRTN